MRNIHPRATLFPILMAISFGVFMTTTRTQAEDQGSFKHANGTGDPHKDTSGHTLKPSEDPNQSRFSVSAGTDITSAYFFRGFLQEDQGFIIQPWLETKIRLTDKTSLVFGIWNSFHDRQTGATNNHHGPDSWYESDLFVELEHEASHEMELTIGYTALTFPNDSLPTVHELELGMSYDDSGSSRGSGLQPHVLVAIELDGQTDEGSNEGTYLELGIEPSCTLIHSKDSPVTLTIPVTVGLSLSDFYEDHDSPGHADDSTFGYVDIGFVLSMPLSDIPADFGQWEVSLGVHYLKLAETTENFNANKKNDEVIFNVGFSMGF